MRAEEAFILFRFSLPDHVIRIRFSRKDYREIYFVRQEKKESQHMWFEGKGRVMTIARTQIPDFARIFSRFALPVVSFLTFR